MRTFCIATLGCKVNQYESEQIAAVLRSRGLQQVERFETADLCVVNTCSVTLQAASKSRQTIRQMERSPHVGGASAAKAGNTTPGSGPGRRIIVTGCWATSDKVEASRLPGVSAVLGHHDDVAAELDQLISRWQSEDLEPPVESAEPRLTDGEETRPEPIEDDGWIMQASTLAVRLADDNKPQSDSRVKENPERIAEPARAAAEPPRGTLSLPQLRDRQNAHQRAFLKVQDGCDAHCTYCIIPNLRSRLWSKPIDDVVSEARRLVGSGHVELILTGIFLGAYGHATALRRRQGPGEGPSLAKLVEALCTRVPGLRRVRLSSLEPGDLTESLLAVLRAHSQVVPHFHLPLQSGSDSLLRRMNRQYRRDDFLRMVDRVGEAFDRPALTTDIIVGFPGETDEEFAQTVDVVNRSKFVHIHAFPFSPRPGTAAARWTRQFVRGPVVNDRVNLLGRLALEYSLAYRRQFVGQTVELLVERPSAADRAQDEEGHLQHGRCERYFSVFFDWPESLLGRCVKVRVDRVTSHRTLGSLIQRG